MKQKIIMVLFLMLVLFSCEKSNDVMVGNESSFSNASLVGDSIIFSPNVRPKGWRLDSTDRRLLIDSFYTNTPLLIGRVTLSCADAGCVTRYVRMVIDDVLIDTLPEESRLLYMTRYFDFQRGYDTIQAGWHELKFKGAISPQMDSLNIYYSLFPGDFICYNLQEEPVKVYGLPIQVKKRYISNLSD